MRSIGRYAVALIAALAAPLSTAATACIPADRSALIVLDASYSMLRIVARTGSSRFSVAREAIGGFVDRFPEDGHLALRLLGSESNITRNNCTDTKLAVPFAPAIQNREVIKATLAQSHARGLTPLALALQQAARDFTDPGRDRLIIVISDGAESCGGDPCAAARVLATEGFMIHTVGFLVDRGSRLQLQCIAQATHGTYVDVPAALDLSDKLQGVLADCLIADAPRLSIIRRTRV